ncbi:HEAT repeat domain-containing protein [Phormidesmis priestleyi]
MLEEATKPQAKIPVLVELRYWQRSIEELIHNSFARHGLHVESLELVLERSLILFDGVNESPSEEARSQLSAFRRNHPKLPMIFTTRDLSLGGDLGIEKKLEMQPLTEAQMQAFIRAYVPEQAEQMLRQLNDRLREFGQTPLLLWMLCDVIDQSPDSILPTNLGGIFKVFTEAYEQSSVRKHEVAALKGDTKPLSDRRLWKKALKALAFLMMQGETPVDFRVVIDRTEAERELNRIFPDDPFPVRDILDDLLKYHLLQNRSVDQIEFRHQLIQEYYAAEALLERLPYLEDDRLKWEFLNYLKWTEPVALMLALVDEMQAVRVVKLALEVDLMLGARLAGEVKRELQEHTLNLLIQDLKAKEAPQLIYTECLYRTRSRLANPELIASLDCLDPDVRKKAIQALGRIGDKGNIPRLLWTLEDSTENSYPVIMAAIDALEKLDFEEKTTPQLLELLKNPYPGVRDLAALALGRLRRQDAIPALIEAMNDPAIRVRRSAISALGSLGCQQIIPRLLLILKTETDDDSQAIHQAVAWALAKLNLEMAFSHPNADVRINAIYLLEGQSSDVALPRFLMALKDSNPFVRRSAVLMLGKLEDQSAIPELIKALDDQEPVVYFEAAHSLGQSNDRRIIPALSKMLEASEVKTRRAVIATLRKLDNEQTIPGLFAALQDSDSDVRKESIYALRQLGRKEAIPEYIEALIDQNSAIREMVIDRASQLDCQESIARLLLATENSDVYVRWNAIKKLAQLASQAVIPELIEVLVDDQADPSRRIRLVLYLWNIGGQAAISGLLRALTAQDSTVRERTAFAIGSIGGSSELAELWRIQFRTPLEAINFAIESIQGRCQFYNYEIYQAHLEVQKADRQKSQNNETAGTIIMNQPIFNQQNATIGVNYAAEGSKQEFTQHSNSSEQNFEILLTDYTQFIDEVQQKYPKLSDVNAVPQIIEVEAKLIKAQDQQRWQNFLSLKQLWKGGKKAGVKVGEHFAENNVWAKGAIAFLEGVSEDVK